MLLDMVVYHKEGKGLQTVREVKISIPFQTIITDIRKSSIVLFLSELLYRSIREEEPNETLFGFLWHALQVLDTTEEMVASFHLVFALKLCKYLGFQPQKNKSDTNRFFSLREGLFIPLYNSPDECLDEKQSAWFYRLMNADMAQLSLPDIPSGTRKALLERILLYYRMHLPGMKEIRSHLVLHEVLSG